MRGGERNIWRCSVLSLSPSVGLEIQDNVGEWAADTRVQFVFSLSITVNAAVTPLLSHHFPPFTTNHSVTHIVPRYAIHQRGLCSRPLSVCLSVCPSVYVAVTVVLLNARSKSNQPKVKVKVTNTQNQVRIVFNNSIQSCRRESEQKLKFAYSLFCVSKHDYGRRTDNFKNSGVQNQRGRVTRNRL